MVENGWRTVSTVPENGRPDCWPWLVEQGSLTQRVRELVSEKPFQLDVLYESQETLGPECADLLGLGPGEPVTIREVSLNRGATPVVFARSVIPGRSTAGSNSWLTKLGNQPLGDALYDAENIERSEFEVLKLDRKHLLYARIVRALGQPDNPVWARRSRVTINGRPILINECFLSIPTS